MMFGMKCEPARVIAISIVVAVAMLYAFQSAETQGRNTQANEEKARGLLNDKRYTFEDLLAGKPETVANAKQIFALTTDPPIKQRFASILLSIGVKDQIYYDYLVSEAQKALDSDMPWPTLYDEHGNKRSKTIDTLDPAFLKWCKEHHQDPRSAFDAAYYEIPVPWYYLAAAGDARAYPLLIQGLHSHNFMIQAWASSGLAKLQDPRAIDEIIGAVQKAPVETHDAVAKALLHFRDPKAQSAADNLITNKEYLEVLRQEIKIKGLKELFPY